MKKKTQFKSIGELPAGGDWQFLLVTLYGTSDAIVVADMKGGFAPRMIIDGKLVEL
jgi:hypothetical protein